MLAQWQWFGIGRWTNGFRSNSGLSRASTCGVLLEETNNWLAFLCVVIVTGVAYCRSDAWEAKLEIVRAAVNEDRTLIHCKHSYTRLKPKTRTYHCR